METGKVIHVGPLPHSETHTDILSRILVTWQEINGLCRLTNRFIGQSPGETTNASNTSKGYWNNNTKSSTLPLLDAPCRNSVSRSVPNLLSSVLFSDWASLGRTLQYLYLFCILVSSVDLSWLYADRIWNTPCNLTLLVFAAASKRIFRCCVNSLYLAVVTENFLYLLPGNGRLYHNFGDVFKKPVT
jgi:hypothetical protein